MVRIVVTWRWQSEIVDLLQKSAAGYETQKELLSTGITFRSNETQYNGMHADILSK